MLQSAMHFREQYSSYALPREMDLMWSPWPDSALRVSAEDKHILGHLRKETDSRAFPKVLCNLQLLRGPAQPPVKDSEAETHR